MPRDFGDHPLGKEMIKKWEQELVEKVHGYLIENDVIRSLMNDKYNLKVSGDIKLRQGDIIVHGNSRAYEFEYEIPVVLRIRFDREGRLVPTEGDAIEAAVEEMDLSEAEMEDGPTSASIERIGNEIERIAGEIEK